MYWFLYDRDLRHQKVKKLKSSPTNAPRFVKKSLVYHLHTHNFIFLHPGTFNFRVFALETTAVLCTKPTEDNNVANNSTLKIFHDFCRISYIIDQHEVIFIDAHLIFEGLNGQIALNFKQI